MYKCSIICQLGLSLTLATVLQAGTLLNQRTSQDQKTPCAASLSNGQAIATWCSYGQDGSSGAIVARLLDQEGVPDSNEWVVNQETQGYQKEPDIAANNQNVILIAWTGPHSDGDSEEIVARLVDPNGTPLTDDLHINQNTAEEQSNPSVCVLTDGSFVVAWESEGIPDSKKCICMRLVSDTGTMLSEEILLSDTPKYTCRYVDIACCPDGQIAGVWLEDRSSNAIRCRSFDPNGTALGDSYQINTAKINNITEVAIAVNPAGSRLIIWDGDPNKGDIDDIHARLYDPNGQALADEFLVNQSIQANQESPCVSAATNGDFIVAWETPAQAENATNLAIRRFGADGQAQSDEIKLATESGSQAAPFIAANAQGSLFILWQSKSEDSSGWDVYAQYTPKIQLADLNADNLVDFHDYALWTSSWPLMTVASNDLWADYQNDHLDLWAFSQQWLQSPTP